MSVRTSAAILTELLKFIPASVRAASPILAGWAAAANLAEQASSDLADNLLYGNAEDEWLDLLAAGAGLSRAPQETNISLRARLRVAPDALTRPAILAAVNALLLPLTATQAIMVEWYEGPYLDVDYLDDPHMPISAGPNTFCLIVPPVGDVADGAAFLGEAYLDDEGYAGSAGNHTIYGSIYSTVEAMRAAGIRWSLVIDQS